MKYLISFFLIFSSICQADENQSPIHTELEKIRIILRENHYALHPHIVHQILERLMIIEFQASWDQSIINRIDRNP